ncbi:MAG: glycoside-pentoside-hexuronide (GPH):cation symporter [Defluviitaleaceae bacterium]|nr:glycoside-pentoside-hexuronide (GPH):cation symporter [Defluviitaleaceae bacterium]MCL2239477.1 glycoside-pentoside-hexuronide (GPH):cation symporter [Defluviitaleaceae bacterium]
MEDDKKIPNDKMGLRKLLSYGAGDFGLTACFSFLSGFILFFMTDYMGIRAGVAGTVLMLSRVLDALTDVWIGNAVDRTKSRFGKARPWLLVCALPFAVSFILLFSVPNLGPAGRLIWFIVLYNLTTTVFYAALVIPYDALIPLMTRNAASRIHCGVVRTIMSIVGGVAFVSLTMPVVNALGGDARAWRIWSVIVGLFMLLCVMIAFVLTRERYGGEKKTRDAPRTFTQSYKSLISNKYWILLTMALVGSNIAVSITGAGAVFYFRYILGNENLMGLASLSMSATLVVVLFLVPVLSKRFSKGTLARISVLGGLAAPLVLMISPASLGLYVVRAAIHGVFTAPFVAVSFAMAADVSDYGYWKTGMKCEGIVNTATGFGIKLGVGIGTGMLGWILELGGFVADGYAQPDSARFALMFVMMGVPIIMAVINFGLLFFYRLDKAHPQIMADIRRMEG